MEVLLEKLNNITKSLARVENKVDKINGNVRDHGKDIAGYKQWRHDYEAKARAQCDAIEDLRQRDITISGIFSTLSAALGTAIGYFLK